MKFLEAEMGAEHSQFPVRRIAALQGAPTATMQDILEVFAQKRARDGLRVAGVIEVSRCRTGGACKSLGVRDLVSGETFSISQDLGAGSTACNLDSAGLIKACGMVEQAIHQGADVVILSKFGKLEAARSGLSDAFRAAMFADIPVVTAVPTIVMDDWERFAGSLSQFVDVRTDALETWWLSQGVAGRSQETASQATDYRGRDPRGSERARLSQ